VFWNSKEVEKAKVGMALQRAQNIELEASYAALDTRSRVLHAENSRLREIISTFIECSNDDDTEECTLLEDGVAKYPLNVQQSSPSG